MSIYLALKEVVRNRSRFFLVSLVIALITVLVLFIAALANGLATANRQFIEKLEADLLVYQENTKLSASASRLDLDKLRRVQRLQGVKDAGLLGFSSGTLVFTNGQPAVDVALVGVQPGLPGDPEILEGPGLAKARGQEAVIDQKLANDTGLQVGDFISVKTIQGTDEEFFSLKVAGITEERRYFYQPSLIVPLETWDEIRPQPTAPDGRTPVIANVMAVQLENPDEREQMAALITEGVSGLETADKQAAIQAIPGYSAQQSTLNTQRIFTLLIGVLVVGGFFQIQTLQKVGQIGMLKAIGSSNGTVGVAALVQIVAVTILGVGIGGLGTLLLSLGLPGNVPIIFNGPAVVGALLALLLIGPIGGLVSIRMALRVDPLTAISQSA